MNPSVSWHLQVRLIIFSQFLIILALDMSDPYWPLIISSFRVLSSQKLQFWSGAIYIAPLVSMVFTTLLWVKIGERIGYKKMILRASFALAITQWCLFFAANPISIFIIRLIQGGLAGFSTAAQAWSLGITPINQHSQVVGRLQAATAMGSIVGPVCGGIISHYFGYLQIFIVAGCLCSFILVMLSKCLSEPLAYGQVPVIEKTKLNFFAFKSEKNVLLLLICGSQVARWMPIPFFTLYISQCLSANTLMVGLSYAIMASAMCLVGFGLGKLIDRQASDCLKWKWVLILALLVSGLSQWGFAFIRSAYIFFILVLFWGLSLGVTSLLLFSFLLKGVKEESRGRIVGLANTAFKLGNLLGITFGTVLQLQGYFKLSFIVVGCFYFILSVAAGSYKYRKSIFSTIKAGNF